MRGFQIWPNNSNWITFDPPFGQNKHWKCVTLDMLPILTVLGQNGGQILFDLNFEAKFGILSSFSIFNDPIWCDFHILIFDHNIGTACYIIMYTFKNNFFWKVLLIFFSKAFNKVSHMRLGLQLKKSWY